MEGEKDKFLGREISWEGLTHQCVSTHRFLQDDFQPINSVPYITAVIHERDKYSWHKAFIGVKCIFMNKWFPLPLTMFAPQSMKNEPTFP